MNDQKNFKVTKYYFLVQIWPEEYHKTKWNCYMFKTFG